MSGWRKAPIEPWSWWFRRHEVKLFLIALAIVIIF
jgi:hypothetical protein